MAKAEKAKSKEFERFDEAVKQIVRVPKKEIERRERERLAKKNGQRKRS
jgi:hypothetical protein